MNLRIVLFGVVAVCGLSAWLWCRPCASEVKAQGAGSCLTVDRGGNEDEAVARYRCNGSHHWRQVALKR